MAARMGASEAVALLPWLKIVLLEGVTIMV